ncbi:hypothetical protein BDZ45DRAFT_119285 [Acephala macrosclerotiorum]|nr:hypothetical protein BDZ45DRAFT_119285 [Acephala macrosclerotiorum]
MVFSARMSVILACQCASFRHHGCSLRSIQPSSNPSPELSHRCCFCVVPLGAGGLVISDFWMAINFMSGSAKNLAGPNIGAASEKTFCSFNEFMIQVFVVQTDYWVLTITVCTYLILANNKQQSPWVQDNRVVIWGFTMDSVSAVGSYWLGCGWVWRYRCL